jgi:hypothetical protein
MARACLDHVEGSAHVDVPLSSVGAGPHWFPSASTVHADGRPRSAQSRGRGYEGARGGKVNHARLAAKASGVLGRGRLTQVDAVGQRKAEGQTRGKTRVETVAAPTGAFDLHPEGRLVKRSSVAVAKVGALLA